MSEPIPYEVARKRLEEDERDYRAGTETWVRLDDDPEYNAMCEAANRDALLSADSIQCVLQECERRGRERDQQERFKFEANKRADAAEAENARLRADLAKAGEQLAKASGEIERLRSDRRECGKDYASDMDVVLHERDEARAERDRAVKQSTDDESHYYREMARAESAERALAAANAKLVVVRGVAIEAISILRSGRPGSMGGWHDSLVGISVSVNTVEKLEALLSSPSPGPERGTVENPCDDPTFDLQRAGAPEREERLGQHGARPAAPRGDEEGGR